MASEKNLAEDMRKTAEDDYERIIEGADEEVEAEEEVEEVEAEEVEEVSEEPEVKEEADESEPEEDESEALDETEEEAVVDPELLNPPSTWKADAKAQWDNVPDFAKREAHRREKQSLDGLEQYKEKAEYGDRIDRAMAPYKDYLNKQGIPAEKAIDEALNLSYTLANSTPQQRGLIIRNMAQMYGADMSVIQGDVDQNQLQVLQLQQEVQNMKRSQLTNQQMSEQQQQQQVQQVIADFANETDNTGRLTHPFFENVKGLMTSLLESGEAQDLGQAYEIAVKAHPDTSALFTSEQMEKVNAERQEAAQKKADKVKKAAKVNLETSPSQTGDKPLGTMRETLEAEAEKLGIL